MFLAGTWSTAFGSTLTLSPFLLGTTGVSAALTRTMRASRRRAGDAWEAESRRRVAATAVAGEGARARLRVANARAEGAMPDIALGSSALNPTIGGGTNRLRAPSAVSVRQAPPGRVTVASGSPDSSDVAPSAVGIVRPLPPRARIVNGDIALFPYTLVGRL